MDLDGRDVVLSAIVVLLAGLALWPPGAIYWTKVAGDIGGGPTLALVGAAAVVIGTLFEYVTEVAIPAFAGGMVLAFAGLATLATLTAPDVPVWIVWYALLVICLFVGVTAVVVYRRGTVQLYPVNWA
jgi:hypothetical protein